MIYKDIRPKKSSKNSELKQSCNIKLFQKIPTTNPLSDKTKTNNIQMWMDIYNYLQLQMLHFIQSYLH